MHMMTASCGRQWRRRRWVSSSGHGAASILTVTVSAQTAIGEDMGGHHHSLTAGLQAILTNGVPTMPASHLHHPTQRIQTA